MQLLIVMSIQLEVDFGLLSCSLCSACRARFARLCTARSQHALQLAYSIVKPMPSNFCNTDN